MAENNLSSEEIDAQRDQRHGSEDGLKILFLYTVDGKGSAGDVKRVSTSVARQLIADGNAEAV